MWHTLAAPASPLPQMPPLCSSLSPQICLSSFAVHLLDGCLAAQGSWLWVLWCAVLLWINTVRTVGPTMPGKGPVSPHIVRGRQWAYTGPFPADHTGPGNTGQVSLDLLGVPKELSLTGCCDSITSSVPMSPPFDGSIGCVSCCHFCYPTGIKPINFCMSVVKRGICVYVCV